MMIPFFNYYFSHRMGCDGFIHAHIPRPASIAICQGKHAALMDKCSKKTAACRWRTRGRPVPDECHRRSVDFAGSGYFRIIVKNDSEAPLDTVVDDKGLQVEGGKL